MSKKKNKKATLADKQETSKKIHGKVTEPKAVEAVSKPVEAKKEKEPKKAKGPSKTPRTTPRNQHPCPEPEKKVQKEIPLPKSNTNVPTGKEVSLAERKKRREAREAQFRNFVINAAKRRAKRMKLSEEDTKAIIAELEVQLNAKHEYHILLLFSKKQHDMIMQILLNNKDVKILMHSNEHAYVDGNEEILKKLREILPAGCKIHPYTKKRANVFAKYTKAPPRKVKPLHSKAEKKALAKKAKLERKKKNIEAFKNRKKGNGKARAKWAKKNRLLSAKKAKKVQMKAEARKKPSNVLKKAHRTLKQAA